MTNRFQVGSSDSSHHPGSSSPGSDVSMQAQLVSVCTHSFFLCAREPVCTISLAAHDLQLRFTSQSEDGETEYYNSSLKVGLTFHQFECVDDTHSK